MSGFIISALFSVLAVGAWLGAIAAAWQHRRGLLVALVSIAVLASVTTLSLVWWFYTN